MPSVIEPEKIEQFGRRVRQQLESAGRTTSSRREKPSAVSLAEASVIGGTDNEEAECAPAQLTISRMQFPHMHGEMRGEMRVKLGTMTSDVCRFYVYETGWRGWFRGLIDPAMIEISLPPVAEAVTLEKADMLVFEGKTQEGINVIYDEIDKSLSTTGPKALDQLLATVEPESLSPPVLLALITVAGMARNHLSNWNTFLQNLENSDIVKDTPALSKTVARLLAQLNADAGQSLK